MCAHSRRGSKALNFIIMIIHGMVELVVCPAHSVQQVALEAAQFGHRVRQHHSVAMVAPKVGDCFRLPPCGIVQISTGAYAPSDNALSCSSYFTRETPGTAHGMPLRV